MEIRGLHRLVLIVKEVKSIRFLGDVHLLRTAGRDYECAQIFLVNTLENCHLEG
jgi:hypothetical protein